MDENLQELEKKLLFFQEKLSLTDVNIRIKNSSRTGVHFDEDLDCYILNYNDRRIDYFIAHELGHILLSKTTNCPTFANPPFSDDVDETIFIILDFLINVIVNSLVSRTNNLYNYYKSFFLFYINLNFGFRNNTELVAFIISTQLEYQFNLKPEDKGTYFFIKMAKYYPILKNQPNFNQKKYDNILLQLHNFKKVIRSFDLQEILDFLFEITGLTCEVFKYMDEYEIGDQLHIFFP